MCIKYVSVYVHVHICTRRDKVHFLLYFSITEVTDSCPTIPIFLLFTVLDRVMQPRLPFKL